MNLNKSRSTGVQIPNAVTENERIAANKDDPSKSTVIVNFYESQEAKDNGDAPFDSKPYVIDTPVNLDNQINVELKKLEDFDQAV